MKPENFDVVILGGGAAGLMCAFTAGKRGKRVLVLEVSNKIGKKILMSGGGRCNFTNLDVLPENFLSQNSHFCKSALKQYNQWDFISMVTQHGIEYEERKHQQLFCTGSAKEILAMLKAECDAAQVDIWLNSSVQSVSSLVKSEPASDLIEHSDDQLNYELVVDKPKQQTLTLLTKSLVVATGGLSIPTLGGATGFAYQLAQQFELTLLPRSAALVPFTLTGELQNFAAILSGVSLPIEITVNHRENDKPVQSFYEDMLFTHRGISGPAILQISSYWQLGNEIEIDILPAISTVELSQALINSKRENPNNLIQTTLANYLPKSVATQLASLWFAKNAQTPLQQWRNHHLTELAERLKAWRFKPSGTEGYRTAEVTLGGIDTNQISSKTMQVKNHADLYFIGEALDVTGHLGGYNFQWAWSSGYVAGENC